jgi:hypothetical protein
LQLAVRRIAEHHIDVDVLPNDLDLLDLLAGDVVFSGVGILRLLQQFPHLRFCDRHDAASFW